ncbi:MULTISPECIES: fimbrial biogenesis usher protein [Pseudomonas]|nr:MULTISPECIES: fimbrial biogenesis usher protein [Pseudomonas]PMY65226.1 outer membrane usher protein PefC [Pseudomonas sp. FW305-25]PMY74440.1 outer membrane usher protein PefC [Pseudomonas sp. FW126-L8]PNA81835.1 outer membrane usher protein PefC [Pseudomonas sp. FW305-76]
MKKPFLATYKGGRCKLVPEQNKRPFLPIFAPLAYAIWNALLLTPIAAQADMSQGAGQASGDFARFDMQTLKARGIDPKLADYFREPARFTEGAHVVSLVVNGVKLGRVEARFDNHGELYFDEALLTKARLKVPGSQYVLSSKDATEKRYDFVAAYPQTEVSLHPNKDEIFLVVPQHALQSDAPQTTNFSRGGTAALFNYDVMAMRSEFGSQSSDYLSGSTDLGFNMGDWIVRSHQLYSKSDDKESFEHLYAYAQRTFTEQKALLQAGQININNPLFSGGAITGVQILPETALMGSARSGARVEGIANAQSTIEVRQVGALIYTTIVPEGPFSLSDIPLLNSNSDLDVKVRDITGAERNFVVSAASFRNAVTVRPGYTFSAGKIRNQGANDEDQPWVITGTGTWSLSESLTATTGLMAATDYQSTGWGVDTNLAKDTSLSVRNLYSHTAKEDVKGTQASVTLSTRFTETVSGSVSATQQTTGYRELSDTTLHADDDWYNRRYKSQYSASLGWSNSTLGSFNVSISPSRTFNGDSTNRLVGSWGKTFKHATVSATVETALSGSSNSPGDSDDAIYFSVSVPLGQSRSVRTYASRRGDNQRFGATYSETINDQFNYRLSTESTGDRGDNYSTANLSAIPRFTSVDLGYAQGPDSKNYNARVSGGAVAHQDGVTFSPYPVQDTFGIVDVGDLSGVKVSTPYGPVWTDYKGKAVVPQLSAYRDSRVEVQTKSLPKRIDLQNGFQRIGAGRGSVSHLDFKVIKVQRILINASDTAGQPLPKGSSVLDDKNHFLTTVLDKGVIFLSDLAPTEVLRVSLTDEKSCLLKIDFPKETDYDAFYDVAPAVCHAP